MPGRNDHLADPATGLLRERVARFDKQLPKALGGDEEGLHRVRVAARRLRVALVLLAPKPDGKRVRRADRLLRQLTRVGGQTRDLDVTSALLAACLAQTREPEAKALLRELRGARARMRRRLAGALLDLDLRRLRRDLAAVQAARGAAIFAVLRRLHTATQAEARAISDALAAVGDAFDPVALHGIRKRFRRLRYTIEIADELRGRESAAGTLIRELQDPAGRLHDAWVLSEWLGRRAARARLRGDHARAGVAERERALAAEAARRHHAELMAKDPWAVLERSVAAVPPAAAA